MIIKDQNGNEITVTDIVLESDNELLSINVTDGKIRFILNDERIIHSQLDELHEDDHPQYLDQVRHSQVDHSGLYVPGDIDELDNVIITNPINEQVLTYANGIWRNITSSSTKNHSLLDNLSVDSHLQYIHNNITRNITAAHIYSTNGAPFILTGNAIGKLVAGLNAEFLSGYKAGDFALKDHTHVLIEVPEHTHPGSDITSPVENSFRVGGKTVDQLAPLTHTHLGSQITSRVPDSSLLEGHNSDYFSKSDHVHNYAPSNQGVTGGDLHEHDGVITKKVNHNNLLNNGLNSHADIDSHIQARANPHAVTKAQVGLSNVDDLKQIPMSILTTKGDLIVGLGSGVTRFPVGVDGAVPVADTTQAMGIRWTPFSTLLGGPYAALIHTHSEYALTSHTHDYAPLIHTHNYLPLTGGNMTGSILMGNNTITGLKAPVNNNDVATKAYVDARTFGVTYIEGVISIENTPPDAPVGNRYIIGGSPTGDWLLYPNYIAEKTAVGWSYTNPINGMVCAVGNDLYAYIDVTGWGPVNIQVTHGSTLNLDHDDHPQYALINGERTITGVWSFNTPFLITSDEVIVNLNAEKLNGFESSDFALHDHIHAELDPVIVKYLKNDGTWDDPAVRYASLSHNHDTLYFTKVQLQTSGEAQVHWDNITSKPSGYVPSIHRANHQSGGIDEIDVSNLNGVLAQEQKAQSHDLLSKHTVSGLTTGHFLKALSSNAFGFAPHGLVYSDVGAAPLLHVHDNYSLTTHNHDEFYSKLEHTHDYSLSNHNHDSVYSKLDHSHSQYALTLHDHNSLYASITDGVTNGNSHDHSGGDGAQISHANLSGVGNNDHTTIDAHLVNANIHIPLDDVSITNANIWSALKTQQAIQAGSAGAMVFKGTFEGNNPPATAEIGWYYKCIEDGGDYVAGDGIVWNGLSWDKIPNIDNVTSVDGRVGVITLNDLYAAFSHTHTQAQSHNLPDTDAGINSLHHTLGTGSNQAAKGSHAAQHKSGGVDTILLSELGGTLTQAKTHDSPDTDGATNALHHTLGTGANQAAAGNHGHSGYALTSHDHTGVYQPKHDELDRLSFDSTDVGLLKRVGYGFMGGTIYSYDVIPEDTYLTGITKAMVEAVLTGAITSHSHAVGSHSHVIADVTNLQTTLNAKAPLASPSLTGVPVAPTAAAGTNTAQIATTAFVMANSARASHSHSGYALASHSHVIADVTNLQTTLDSKSPVGHIHTMACNIQFVMDGGGSVLTPGNKGCIQIPFNCTLTGWTVLGDVSGNILTMVGWCSYSGYPIFALVTKQPNCPQIGNNYKASSSSLSEWKTSYAAGDIIQFGIYMVTAFTRVTVILHVTRSI